MVQQNTSKNTGLANEQVFCHWSLLWIEAKTLKLQLLACAKGKNWVKGRMVSLGEVLIFLESTFDSFGVSKWVYKAIIFDSVVLSKTLLLKRDGRGCLIKNKNLKFIFILCDMQTLCLTVCANKWRKMEASVDSQKGKKLDSIYWLQKNITREII